MACVQRWVRHFGVVLCKKRGSEGRGWGKRLGSDRNGSRTSWEGTQVSRCRQWRGNRQLEQKRTIMKRMFNDNLWEEGRLERNGKTLKVGDLIGMITVQEGDCVQEARSLPLWYLVFRNILSVSSWIAGRSKARLGQDSACLTVGFHLIFLHISLWLIIIQEILENLYKRPWLWTYKMQTKQNHLELWDILWFDWRTRASISWI